MKTKKVKEKLSEALRNLPGDFALSTTRQHIVNALKSIQKYEERHSDDKQKDLDLHQQWWGNVVSNSTAQATSNVTQEAMSKTLSYIDLLIDKEKKNLETIQLEREKEAGPNTIFLS